MALRLCALLGICLALISPTPSAQAQDIVADLSQRSVSITANFDGSELMIFGAIRRDGPSQEADPLEIIITVSGPSEPVLVRRKEKVAGIWVNTEAVEVDAAPSFYAITSTGPMADILADTEDLRHRISIPRAIRSVGAPQEVDQPDSFTDALIRIRKDEGLYRVEEGGVSLQEQTLFRSRVALPANLVEGDYEVRIFLTRDKQIVAEEDTLIAVRKVGLERFIYTLAHEQPLVYGLLSLTIAIVAGWGASTAFRYLQS